MRDCSSERLLPAHMFVLFGGTHAFSIRLTSKANACESPKKSTASAKLKANTAVSVSRCRKKAVGRWASSRRELLFAGFKANLCTLLLPSSLSAHPRLERITSGVSLRYLCTAGATAKLQIADLHFKVGGLQATC